MKIKNKDILILREGLIELQEEKMSVQVAFTIAKNLQEIEMNYNIIQNLRDKIVIENGEPKEDGSYQIPKEKIDFVNEELDKLSNMDNSSMLGKISLQDLSDIKISPILLQKLLLIIEE